MEKKKEVATNYAPNDPRRVPKEHREFVNWLYKFLAEEKVSSFDAQIITQTLSHSVNAVDAEKVLTAALAILKKFKEVNGSVDKQLLIADLQILGTKLTEAFNKMNLSGIQFEEF